MAAISTLADTFDGPSLGAQWAQAVNGTLSAVSIDAGRAKLVAGTEANSFAVFYSETTYDATGGAVYVQVESFGNQPTGWSVRLLIDTNGAESNYARLQINSNEVLGQIYNGGTQVFEGSAVAYSAVNHKWLRIRHTSGDNTLHFETSPDGTTWTDHYQSSAHSWSVASVLTGVRAQCESASSSPGEVVYVDNFNTPPAAAPAPSWFPFFFRAAGGAPGGGGGGWTPNPAAVKFLGDYSTGNFSQWATIQNHRWNDPPTYGAGWPLTGNYELQIATDGEKGNVARFECRNGDTLLGFPDATERTEVRQLTGESNGETCWYEFAFKVDANPNEADWGVLQQWHTDDAHNAVPPVQFGWTNWDGANSDYVLRLMENMAWHVPYTLGVWMHITLKIKWHVSTGELQLWYNHVPQLISGSYIYTGPTQVNNGAVGVYYKEGIYRSEFCTATKVVFHHGYRVCTSPAGLTWDISTA